MKVITIALATALAMTSSLAFAQPRLAVARTLETARCSIAGRSERSVRTWIFEPIDRSAAPRLAHPRQARSVKHRRRHVADYRH